MRARVKTAWRQASKLHGATAGYVSLVDRGANETPFKEIKAAKGVGAMGIKKRTDLAKSHKKIAKGKKEAPAVENKTVMAKIVFAQDNFQTEQDVRDWIEKAEWDAESVDVVDDGEGNFVARPSDTTDSSYKQLAPVETDDEGVTAFVGVLEVESKTDDEADDDEEDDDTGGDDDDDDGDDEDDGDDTALKAVDKPAQPEPAKKSARAEFIAKAAKTTVAKFSGWDSFYSKKTTLAEAIKAGMEWDATPPGFYDVQLAFNGVVSNILGDESESVNKAEALQKAASDYADMLVGMDSFFDSVINAGEEMIKKSLGDHAESVTKWAEGYARSISGESAEPSTTKKAEKVQKATGEQSAIDESTIAALIAKAVAPAIDKIDEVAGTVAKMAQRRPTTKSADLTDAGSGNRQSAAKTEADATGNWLLEKQKKALIG